MQDCGGKSIKFEQAKFMDLGSQSRGFTFNVTIRRVRIALIVWLVGLNMNLKVV